MCATVRHELISDQHSTLKVNQPRVATTECRPTKQTTSKLLTVRPLQSALVTPAANDFILVTTRDIQIQSSEQNNKTSKSCLSTSYNNYYKIATLIVRLINCATQKRVQVQV
ncbi:unnamed protein product [Leptidea sinapis]|uniref:Uncharacterized protein n=1 Tax=Leptidea sinapis TaxID=189913 RepID=A0A5E4QAN1_9NEOP|nr:unnamed protein product [Leptidea sinapis]